MIRILIVDDHHIVRTGLRTIVSKQQDMLVVAEAGTAAEALQCINELNPDVVLLDLGLPDRKGFDVIKEAVGKYPKTNFVVLSVYDGSEDIYVSLQNGAKSYLLKDCRPSELLDAIREAFAGRRYMQKELATRLAERLAAEYLTSRELEVLEKVVEGKSNKEIAQDLDVAERTVKTHLANVFGKLQVTSRSQAAFEAVKRGLVHVK
jgi:DNA-binding NarL/FixJ family response regulator